MVDFRTIYSQANKILTSYFSKLKKKTKESQSIPYLVFNKVSFMLEYMYDVFDSPKKTVRRIVNLMMK